MSTNHCMCNHMSRPTPALLWLVMWCVWLDHLNSPPRPETACAECSPETAGWERESKGLAATTIRRHLSMLRWNIKSLKNIFEKVNNFYNHMCRQSLIVRAGHNKLKLLGGISVWLGLCGRWCGLSQKLQGPFSFPVQLIVIQLALIILRLSSLLTPGLTICFQPFVC